MASGVDGTERGGGRREGWHPVPLFFYVQPRLRGPPNLGRVGGGRDAPPLAPFLGPLGGLPPTERLARLCIDALYPPLLETNPDNCT